MAQDGSEPSERWTAKRRVTLVVSILKEETSVVRESPSLWLDRGQGRGVA
ncbi:MAG: hypothetical protein OJF51_003650 [Nitrospira sp.]|jgi:hypothetical protein|nr:MAG: hypothetical protein OJF51_003650 [Nitrospira sp.]